MASQIDGKRAKPEPGAQPKRASQLDGEAEPPHVGRRSRSSVALIQMLILLLAASASAQTPLGPDNIDDNAKVVIDRS